MAKQVSWLLCLIWNPRRAQTVVDTSNIYQLKEGPTCRRKALSTPNLLKGNQSSALQGTLKRCSLPDSFSPWMIPEYLDLVPRA